MIYEVLIAPTPAVLAELVNEKLSAGWRPQGGVAVTVLHRTWESNGCSESDTDWEYAQAVVSSLDEP